MPKSQRKELVKVEEFDSVRFNGAQPIESEIEKVAFSGTSKATNTESS